MNRYEILKHPERDLCTSEEAEKRAADRFETRKREAIEHYMSMHGGPERLAASMAQPLRTAIDYPSMGAVFSVSSMPDAPVSSFKISATWSLPSLGELAGHSIDAASAISRYASLFGEPV